MVCVTGMGILPVGCVGARRGRHGVSGVWIGCRHGRLAVRCMRIGCMLRTVGMRIVPMAGTGGGFGHRVARVRVVCRRRVMGMPGVGIGGLPRRRHGMTCMRVI